MTGEKIVHLSINPVAGSIASSDMNYPVLVAGFHFLIFREAEVSVDARFCDWQLAARPQ